MEELMPSPVNITLERFKEVIILRPYAINIPGTGVTPCHRRLAATDAASVSPARPGRKGRNAHGASTHSPLTAAMAISRLWLFAVPTAGARIRLNTRAPRIAPPVLAA